MEYEELKEALMDYFGDTSRSAGQTKGGLLSIADEAMELASTIEDATDFSGDTE